MSDIDCRHKVVDHNQALSGRILKTDPRTIMLASVMNSDRPEVPSVHDWRPKVHEAQERQGSYHVCKSGHRHFEWGAMGNKKLNNCTIATGGHMVQTWTSNAKDFEVTVSDAEVIAAYSELTGYNPQTTKPEKSPGSSCLDALKLWRKSGIGGHRIHSFVGLSGGNRQEIQDAIYMFGSAYVGLLLPATAKTQGVWDVVPTDHLERKDWWKRGSNTWMAHAACAVSYSDTELTIVTWGYEKRMTWDFYKEYSDEAFGVLSDDWIDDSGYAPNFINVDKLELALQALKH